MKRSPERVLNSLSGHSKDSEYKFERLYWMIDRLNIIKGEPDTLRGVSPVRRRAYGNLS
jgi:hypothetical protein